MIEASRVVKVYSGRPGCMCGCRGSYRWAEQHRDKVHDYLDADEHVSDRSVRTIVRKLNADPGTKVENGIAFLDTGTRYLAAYMEEGA